MEAIQILTKQLEVASKERKPIVMMGDMNLCSTKWMESDFTWKKIAEEVQGTLINCGLKTVDLGLTYLADRLNEMCNTIESALDHMYISEEFENSVKCSKLKDGGTDHVPIMAIITLNNQSQSKPRKQLKGDE